MIKIENLHAGYGVGEKSDFLNIKNAVFEEGKITGIVGLNGSGKSTLLKTVIGINSISSGDILIDGKKVKSLGHKGRAREVAYLPQSYAVPNMDIYTLVSHGRFPYLGFSKVLGQRDIQLVENALHLTDLWEFREKNLSEISGGQRQRAYLAMVIAQDTKYLLLDEATSSLDIKHQLEILNVLKKLAAQGRGIVITCHDLPQSFSVCNKIYLLEKGAVAAEGSPEEIAVGEKLLKVMGVGVKKSELAESLYEYQLVK